MNRATFLKRSALLAAGVVALGNEELLERLSWEPKRLWTGASMGPTTVSADGYIVAFDEGDCVAWIRSGQLVEFGRVTAVGPRDITVSWPSTRMSLRDGDLMVYGGPVPMS